MRRRRLTREALEARVDVEVAAAGEAAQREAAVLGERDGQRGRRADADEHRRAGDGRLLHELEREPPADAQQPVAQREQPVEQRAPDDLVHRVVAPDVLARVQELPVAVEEAGRVDAAGELERGLAQTVGQRGEELARDDGPRPDDRALHGDLLERALAAHAARRRRVEVPRAGVAEQRALDLDDVRREVLRRPGAARRVDQPLAVEEAERELLVVARRAHRHGERLAVDADLERLLERDAVLPPLADDPGGEVHRIGLGHAVVLAQHPPLLRGAEAEYARHQRDADADRHARPALPARARAGEGALAPAASADARLPPDGRQRRVLRRRVPRAAVRHVRADDRRDDAVLRRRARPAADRRRALEQPAVAGLRRPQVRLRQVLGERHLLRRGALRRVPRRPRLAVAALVLAGAADREQVEVGRAPVDELAADGRRDADQLAGLVRGLLALDEQAERSLEHEVYLLLALVGVDAAALAGVQHDLVEPEARHAELVAQAHEAVLGVGLQARRGGAVLHGRDPTRAAARSSQPPRRPPPRR